MITKNFLNWTQIELKDEHYVENLCVYFFLVVFEFLNLQRNIHWPYYSMGHTDSNNVKSFRNFKVVRAIARHNYLGFISMHWCAFKSLLTFLFLLYLYFLHLFCHPLPWTSLHEQIRPKASRWAETCRHPCESEGTSTTWHKVRTKAE